MGYDKYFPDSDLSRNISPPLATHVKPCGALGNNSWTQSPGQFALGVRNSSCPASEQNVANGRNYISAPPKIISAPTQMCFLTSDSFRVYLQSSCLKFPPHVFQGGIVYRRPRPLPLPPADWTLGNPNPRLCDRRPINARDSEPEPCLDSKQTPSAGKAHKTVE